MKRLLAGLWRHHDFRLLWAGQTISLLGSQITALALPVAAALTLHADALQMGILSAANSLPALVFGLFVGVVVDRFPRRSMLIAADLGRALLLGSIPLAALFSTLTIWQLYLVTFLAGVLTLVFAVAHMSWLPSLVRQDDLVEGNSKLELSRSGAVIVGPGLAGLLIQALTAPFAIVLDALSFLGSAAFLAHMRTREQASAPTKRQTAVWSDIVAGIRTITDPPILRSFLASLAAFNFFSYMIRALYVLYVLSDLGVSPALLGLIYAAGSIGFPIGAVLAGPVARRFGTGPTIIWGAGLSNAAYLLILAARGPLHVVVPLLVAAQFLISLPSVITAINQSAMRQALTPDEMRGRVNGASLFLATGLGTIGGLLAGSLVNRWACARRLPSPSSAYNLERLSCCCHRFGSFANQNRNRLPRMHSSMSQMWPPPR
jgi:MFS family permease